MHAGEAEFMLSILPCCLPSGTSSYAQRQQSDRKSDRQRDAHDDEDEGRDDDTRKGERGRNKPMSAAEPSSEGRKGRGTAGVRVAKPAVAATRRTVARRLNMKATSKDDDYAEESEVYPRLQDHLTCTPACLGSAALYFPHFRP